MYCVTNLLCYYDNCNITNYILLVVNIFEDIYVEKIQSIILKKESLEER